MDAVSFLKSLPLLCQKDMWGDAIRTIILKNVHIMDYETKPKRRFLSTRYVAIIFLNEFQRWQLGYVSCGAGFTISNPTKNTPCVMRLYVSEEVHQSFPVGACCYANFFPATEAKVRPLYKNRYECFLTAPVE